MLSIQQNTNFYNKKRKRVILALYHSKKEVKTMIAKRVGQKTDTKLLAKTLGD